jgi:parallel beta-helix repeat protein/predicted outer membrane repeat protein
LKGSAKKIHNNQNDKEENVMQRKMGFLSSLFILVLGIFVLGSTTAFGATIRVPADYPTIQTGIDAASSADTVLVADGTYMGTGNKDLDFGGKAIAVRSENGPDNCIIDCENDGRGFYFNHNETALSVVEGFTITNGHDDDKGGGGMYMQNASPVIIDCIFSGNSASYGGAIRCTSSSPTIANCTISGNQASYGGGIGCWSQSSPTITNCTISDNTATEAWGGGIILSASSPDITDCIIRDNTAVQSGGIECTDGSSPTISACTIKGNQAQFGGGIRCYRGAAPTITNCIITGNTASGIGGGIVCQDYAKPFFVNCTIADNEAGSYGGGIVCHGYPSWPTLTNCILWGDTPDEIASNTATVTYCDVQGGYTGVGNIDVDPLFVGGGDCHLTPDSPCIDAGTNGAPWLPPEDKDGNPRIVNGIVDMGAYEYQDGVVDPTPDVKANDSDGPIIINQGNLLTVTISLDPGSHDGENADWWVAATSPFGFYWFALDSGWISGTPIRVYGGPLFNLSPYTILEISTLPVGNYIFYFAVDDNMDGILDATYLDFVLVTIQ